MKEHQFEFVSRCGKEVLRSGGWKKEGKKLLHFLGALKMLPLRSLTWRVFCLRFSKGDGDSPERIFMRLKKLRGLPYTKYLHFLQGDSLWDFSSHGFKFFLDFFFFFLKRRRKAEFEEEMAGNKSVEIAFFEKLVKTQRRTFMQVLLTWELTTSCVVHSFQAGVLWS